MVLKVLAEVILGAQEIWICKVEERKVFREIVLSTYYVSEILAAQCQRIEKPVLEYRLG
jgi:hypothetical protein